MKKPPLKQKQVYKSTKDAQESLDNLKKKLNALKEKKKLKEESHKKELEKQQKQNKQVSPVALPTAKKQDVPVVKAVVQQPETKAMAQSMIQTLDQEPDDTDD